MGFGALLGKSILGGIMGGRSARRHNKKLSAWYNQAIQETPAEKEYREKLEKASREGDPYLNERRQEIYRHIFSYAKKSKAGATGNLARRGLENSIIGDEIRSKIDAKMYQTLDLQADKILAHNKAYKKDAENKLMQYKLSRDSRLRNLAMSYQQGQQSGPDAIEMIAGAGIEALSPQSGGDTVVNLDLGDWGDPNNN